MYPALVGRIVAMRADGRLIPVHDGLKVTIADVVRQCGVRLCINSGGQLGLTRISHVSRDLDERWRSVLERLPHGGICAGWGRKRVFHVGMVNA